MAFYKMNMTVNFGIDGESSEAKRTVQNLLQLSKHEAIRDWTSQMAVE